MGSEDSPASLNTWQRHIVSSVGPAFRTVNQLLITCEISTKKNVKRVERQKTAIITKTLTAFKEYISDKIIEGLGETNLSYGKLKNHFISGGETAIISLLWGTHTDKNNASKRNTRRYCKTLKKFDLT